MSLHGRHLTSRAGALVALVAIVAGLASCADDLDDAPARRRAAPPPVQAMEVDVANWNLANADFGTIATSVDLGDQLIVFSNKGMFVVAGGVISAQDSTITEWSRSAAEIPAADGNGAWAVAVDGTGTLQRVYAASKLEPVSDRYGLLGTKVRGLAKAASPDAPGAVAFSLVAPSIAFSDGQNVHRYGIELDMVSATSWRIAGIAPDGAVLSVALDPKNPSHDAAVSRVDVDGAIATAFDGDGRLLVATKRALYRDRSDGVFESVFDATEDLHGLVATPDGVWFGVGPRLCLYDGTELRCADAGLDPTATLVGSTRGVYAIEQGKMRALERKATGAEAYWRQAVRPVFARVCSSCHARGGTSGIDMSSYKAWVSLLTQTEDRVLVKKNMPTNQTLSGTDYQTIRTWVDCQRDATRCPAP